MPSFPMPFRRPRTPVRAPAASRAAGVGPAPLPRRAGVAAALAAAVALAAPAAHAACAWRAPRVALTVDNDSLTATRADGGYTSGVRIDLFDDAPASGFALDRAVESALGAGLDERCTGAEGGGAALRAISIGQAIYTPRELENPAPQPQDRPWAGWLYAARSWEVLGTDGGRLRSRRLDAAVGAVGDASLARQSQKLVHRILGYAQPQGWDNQLRNQVGVSLNYLERVSFGDEHRDLVVHWGGNLGNTQTYANAGATLRYGRALCDLGPGPGATFSGAAAGPAARCNAGSDALRWQVFAGVDVRAVAWDLFLQGDPRRGESAIDPARVVADARIGAAIAQGRWRFTYTLVMRSREFGGPNAVRYPALAFAGATLSY